MHRVAPVGGRSLGFPDTNVIRFGRMDENRVSQVAAPKVVAHRGDAANFPENTVAALVGATACGVRCVEFDVQLTADRVPVVLHDESLLRTGGIDRLASASIASEVTQMRVGEPQRFGQRFQNECVPTLSTALEALAEPELTVFVELKRQSLHAFGRQRVLAAVLPVLKSASPRIVLVSFDRTVLEYVRAQTDYPIGWVLSDTDDDTRVAVAELAPDYLFCNYQRLAHGTCELWPGVWDWVIYEVTDADHARVLGHSGAAYVESMAACRLNNELHA